MSNPERHPERYAPHNPDEDPSKPDANKRQMQSKESDQPKYIPPKGK
ncbi:MAG TPA: hypothetical protein VF199_13720 [Bacillales bacterium]